MPLSLCPSIAGGVMGTVDMHSSARTTRRPLAFRVETWWSCTAKPAIVSSLFLHVDVGRSRKNITAPLSVKSKRILLTEQKLSIFEGNKQAEVQAKDQNNEDSVQTKNFVLTKRLDDWTFCG